MLFIYPIENPGMPDKVFVDTNLWIYLFLKSKNPADKEKRNKVKKVLGRGYNIAISTQVINEISNVFIKKYNTKPATIRKFLTKLFDISEVFSLTEENTLQALGLTEKYSLSFYDALIASSALDSNCTILPTEDLQNGLVINDRLRIVNPFD